jgi:peptide-methionine (R)-S-oxide reductase
MNRRALLLAGGAACFGGAALLGRRPALAAQHFEVTLTPDQWRKRLTPAQFQILREQGTEPPWSSPLLNEHRAGVFACAGCDLPVFNANTKFDSHTGWPSFWRPLPDAVETSRDTSDFMVRDEVHCRRCGGHLGHVFNDGPPPTGLRYCMDGLALTFKPA